MKKGCDKSVKLIKAVRNIKDKDPANPGFAQVLFLYPGFHILIFHKVAHSLYNSHCFFLARLISQLGRFFTGIEIHPGAKIGDNLFIDHGMGVVIGETAEIGNDVTIYHGVTLGGTGKEHGKRHPTVGNGVLIGAGVKVLGPIKIGDRCRIGSNSTVLINLPDDSTAVGSPAVVVGDKKNKKVNTKILPSEELDQNHYPNIIEKRIEELERKLKRLEKRDSK